MAIPFRLQYLRSAMDNRLRCFWSAGQPSFTQHADSEAPAWSQPHTRIVRMETDFTRALTSFELNPMCLRHR